MPFLFVIFLLLFDITLDKMKMLKGGKCMIYLFRNKENEKLLLVRGIVKVFYDAWKCGKYYRRNRLEQKGYEIVVDGIDEDANRDFVNYL